MTEPSVPDQPIAGADGTPEEKGGEDAPSQHRFRTIMSWVVVVVLTVLGIYLLIKLMTIGRPDPLFWHKKVRDQFPVMVGLPMAGMGALFVTLVLRAAHGPMEFEGLGFKFKGGAGPIIFWFVCFLGIVMSIKLLWI